MPTTRSLTIKTAERPGGDRPSEDRIFQTDNAVIILDGATQAFALERTGGWIAEKTGQRLAAGLQRDPAADLRTLLKSTIIDLVDEYHLEPGSSPSTTVSIARFNEDTIDVLVLCDSLVIVLDTAGEVTEVCDDRLARVSSSLTRPAGLRDLANPAWTDRIRAFETYRNNPKGFWCVSASPEAADHAIVQRFMRADCQALMLMTDGVSCVVDSYQALPNWRAAVEIAKTGPDRLTNLVHEVELSDPNAIKWPRGKIHDDKAVAIVAT